MWNLRWSVFAFIITYEALGWWGHQEYQDQEDVIVGGLFYYFWKKFAKVSGLNPKKSYVTLGWIVATICYILPWIAAAIWAVELLTVINTSKFFLMYFEHLISKSMGTRPLMKLSASSTDFRNLDMS